MLALAKIFQSGMMLQRDKPVKIWGSAAPGGTVEVTVGPHGVTARTDAGGRWMAVLPPLPAGTGLTVTVSSGGERTRLEDVAVGEVWIAAGQSNMEFWLRYEAHRREETEELPDLRFYDVPKLSYPGQERDFDYSQVGRWRRAVGAERDWFSAVGYYFQKELAAALDVPVGIVGCSWGGTPSCAWMSREYVKRAGKIWLDAAQADFQNIDRADYLRRMARKPDNDTGRPFQNPFNEFMLPRTPDQKEIDTFLAAQPPVDPVTAALPLPQNAPGILWERMVATVAPFPVRGVLWYQGESDDNGGRGALYKDMLAALAACWREAWSERLPFLIVQLPGWESWFGFHDQGFPTIRECQRLACLEDPDMQLCSISDAGQRLDIHPKDKKTVGHRLALLALGRVYGRPLLCDPPYPRSAVREGKTVKIAFQNAGEGLTVRGEPLSALEVFDNAGAVDFETTVSGDTLTVILRRDAGPVSLRFAQTCWFQVNLYNSAGLPAIPFTLKM